MQTVPGLDTRPAVLPVEILPQPDDETCGPTCLHAVYRYWGDDIALREVVESVRTLTAQGRGTLALMLGVHSLGRRYKACLYTFNVHGEPAGHFVVLHGYDLRARQVTVADPLADNPGFDSQRYSASMSRLVPSIMLGVLTYDANLLVIKPGEHNDADAT